MSRYSDLEQMLVIVAQALGDELLQQVVFVGGCATALLITDKATLESVRYTDDVDLITHVIKEVTLSDGTAIRLITPGLFYRDQIGSL